MKKLLALIVLVLPMIATAGPEDHTPGAVYRATTSPLPYYLMELVFDSATLTNDESTVVLYARYGNFFGDFKVTEASRHNEDIVTYAAEKELFNRTQSSCGFAEKATATIKARNHISFGMSARDLDITVEYTTVADICHSRPQTQVIKYEIIPE